jgi:hypothetical protein
MLTPPGPLGYCYWCQKLKQGDRPAITVHDGNGVCERHLDGPQRRNKY